MDAVSFDRAHAWDYLVYAYLQQGQDGAAREVLDTVRNATAAPSIATDYAFAAIPARLALEREVWADAASLVVRPSPGFLPGEAITRFARGIGAARAGDVAAARREIPALEAIRDSLDERGDTYWREIVDAQRLAVEAWVSLRDGETDRALELIAAAADIEERVDKHPVTPGPILPSRELEGDMLLLLERPGDAHRAFVATLRTDPNRARSLFGAARAAEAAGMQAEAREYYQRFVAQMATADTEGPQLERARRYLATGDE
jgi:tetratricopeptide (TPR) repeat protein